MIAQKISHYRILDKLGSGGMGEVYLAEDARLGRKLALKILPAEFTKDAERVARFRQEARAASALNHPNIITIYEVGEENGVHFIATEFIEGLTLRQRLALPGMTLPGVLEIAIQIAGALQAAHEVGVTHRDIKPENVMVRPDGIVKVLDFGLAKLTELRIVDRGLGIDENPQSAIRNPQLSIPGAIMGTVTYMSPEQARGLSVDARSDIFSLGVMLYEMIAGRIPFNGPTTSDVLAAILTAEPTPLSDVVSGAPAELVWGVSKALSKSRDERYQTIKSFLSDLNRVKNRLSFEAELGRLGSHSLPNFPGHEQSEAVTVELTGHEGASVRLAPRSGSSTAPGSFDSLAILPLSNAGDDAGMEYLSDGITESIINSLAQLPQLRVVPRSTVFRYKGQAIDLQQIGRELGVRVVLTGRVLQLGDSLIVKTELVDLDTQSQLWGEQYRRRMTDIFELQDEIAEEISEKLRLRLTGEDKRKLVKRYTDNAEAYRLYLKGRYYIHKRTPDWIRKGITYFQEAIDLDPNYALAYAGLGEAFGFLASSTGGQPPREAYPKAKAAAQKALDLDEELGEAHCSMGFFRLLYDWDFAAAERDYKRAIELSPNFANAYDGYGFYLKATGQREASIEACRRARELEPLSLFLTLSLGWAYYFARQYEESLTQSRKVLEMDPNFAFAYWHRGMVYLQTKKHAEAIESFRKAINLAGSIPSYIAYLGYSYALAGKQREARQMLAQLQSLAKKQYVSAYFIGVLLMGLGELNRAFEYFEKAYEERSGFLAFVRVEPMLDVMRGDARFQELIEKIG